MVSSNDVYEISFTIIAIRKMDYEPEATLMIWRVRKWYLLML